MRWQEHRKQLSWLPPKYQVDFQASEAPGTGGDKGSDVGLQIARQLSAHIAVIWVR